MKIIHVDHLIKVNYHGKTEYINCANNDRELPLPKEKKKKKLFNII